MAVLAARQSAYAVARHAAIPFYKSAGARKKKPGAVGNAAFDALDRAQAALTRLLRAMIDAGIAAARQTQVSAPERCAARARVRRRH